MDFDEILPVVGEYGRYQKLVVWFILLPATIPCGLNIYNQIFMSATPDHWCYIPELEYLLPHHLDLYKNISIPLETNQSINSQKKYSKCHMWNYNYTKLINNIDINTFQQNDNINSVPIVSCQTGWIYDQTQYQSTVVTEWDLVCDKDIYPTIALVCLGIGSIIGNFAFGYIQDGFGRKPTFFIYLLILCFFGSVTAFANNFAVWTIFRIGVGFTLPAIMNAPLVLALEIVGPKYRTTINILYNIIYSLTLVGLSGVVYLVRNWRLQALTTSVPLIIYFFYWYIMPESPRWLLSQGRIEEMNMILITMAKLNRKPLPHNYLKNLTLLLNKASPINSPASYGVFDLIRTPNLRAKTIIITFIWFVCTAVYAGLSYYAPLLGGDEYLNFFLAAIVELPTYLFLWPAMEKLGRRWILCLSMMVGGLACLGTFLVKDDNVITLVLYCLGKMGISCSFAVTLLITSEIYPTVIRGIAIGICSLVGGLGPIVIPFVNYLGNDMLTLPLIIMGVILIFGGAISLLLPETLRTKLPQTLQDGELIGLTYAKSNRKKYENSEETLV